MKKEIHVCDGQGCGKALLGPKDGLVFKGNLTGPTGEVVHQAAPDVESALCWTCLEKAKPAQEQPVIPTLPPGWPFIQPSPYPYQPPFPGDIYIGTPPADVHQIIIRTDTKVGATQLDLTEGLKILADHIMI